MLDQSEIPAYIARQIPQVGHEMTRPGMQLTAYQSVQVLTDYTKRMALEHNFKMVGNCMRLMEKLYQKGNAAVRGAVENVFIYSFSSMMCSCNIVEWRIVQSYMPSELYAVYVEQVLRSKC
jgi:hypothetical protein